MSVAPPTIPLAVVLPLCVAASVWDLKEFRVPRPITLGLLVTGPVYHVAVSGGGGLAFALLGTLFGFALLLGPYLAGGMGGGDVKLMAGVGAWIGLTGTLFVALVASLAAGAAAAALALARGRWRETRDGIVRLLVKGRGEGDLVVANAVAKPDRRTRLVPFAPAVVVGLTIYGLRLWGHV